MHVLIWNKHAELDLLMSAFTDLIEHGCLRGAALADDCSQHSIKNASFCGNHIRLSLARTKAPHD